MVNFVKYFRKPVFLSTLICIFLFYSGIIKLPEYYTFNSLIQKNQIHEITGKIVSSPAKCSNGKYYSATLDLFQTISNGNIKSDAKGRVKIFIPTEMVEVFFPGKLYSSAKTKGCFLYESGGIYNFKGKISKSSFYVSECKCSLWENNVFSKIDYFRALCRLQFKRLMFSWGEAGGFLLALLCGAKEYTDVKISESFKNAGLSHILALSGMHLSMFSSIAIFIGNKTGRKRISFIIRLIALFCFVWFAGFSPSLLRAYICAMLTLIATMSGTKQPDMLMILCFSFLIQSIISPTDIYNIGFILSYTALAGIIIFNKTFAILFNKLFPKQIASSLASSSAAQIFTMPISLKLFGSFAPIGIIATSFISPLVTIFIYSGLILIILSLIFPILSSYSEFIMKFMYNIIKYSVGIFSNAPKWSLN